MQCLLALGLAALCWAQSATQPPLETIVVLGSGPASELKEESKEQPSTTPLTLEERVKRFEERDYTIRREGSVAYAYSAQLWPAAGLSNKLKSVQLFAGSLGPDGILRLDGQSEFVTQLSDEFERVTGWVIAPTTALTLESDQQFEVTNGDRTFRLGGRLTPLPASSRALLAERPLRRSTRTIEERMQMRATPTVAVAMLPVRSVTVHVYGRGGDWSPPRRLELVSRGMARMADELAAFQTQYAAAYEDLARTMAANGLAPSAERLRPGPVSALPDDLQLTIRMMVSGQTYRGGDLGALAEANAFADAFVQGATMSPTRMNIVLKAYGRGPDGREVAIGIQLTPP